MKLISPFRDLKALQPYFFSIVYLTEIYNSKTDYLTKAIKRGKCVHVFMCACVLCVRTCVLTYTHKHIYINTFNEHYKELFLIKH